jgi:hypothetical protein
MSTEIVTLFFNVLLDLETFGKDTFELMQIHIDKLKKDRQEVTQAFTFIQDCDTIYQQIREKVHQRLLEKPTMTQVVHNELGYNRRSQFLYNHLEE